MVRQGIIHSCIRFIYLVARFIYFMIAFSSCADIFIKIFQMKKVYAYLVGGSMIGLSLFISQGCTKDTGGETELIGNWTRASDFDGTARSEAVCFVIGDFAYIATGTTDRERLKDIWAFSLSNNYWSQKKDLPAAARNSAIGFSIGSKGYLGTGFDGANRLADFWEYDPAANDWIQKDDFKGSARYDAVAFSLNNKGYVSCGYDGNYLKDLWQFDPAAPAGSQWTQKASIGGTKRSAATAFVFNNNAYIVSGNNNGEILRDLWMYDANTDQWIQKKNIYNYSEETYDDKYTTIARQNAVAFVMNNYVYLATGENGAVVPNTWQYDPVNDQWTDKTAFEGTARTGAVAFALSNRGFVMTGRSGSSPFDNGYEFHPTDEKTDGD
jgi:N-acetylneuraminic acid mutarotase